MSPQEYPTTDPGDCPATAPAGVPPELELVRVYEILAALLRNRAFLDRRGPLTIEERSTIAAGAELCATVRERVNFIL